MKRRWMRFAAVVGAVLCLVMGVAGCSSGPTVEELITQDIQESFDQLKDPESQMRDDFAARLEEQSSTDLENLGIEADTFVNALLDGFDYQINGVEADEEAGAATASVTVTSKSVQQILTDFEASAQEYVGSYVANALATGSAEVDEDAVNKDIGQLFMDAVNNAAPRDYECSFGYTRDDEGVWNIDGDALDELTAALMDSSESSGDAS